MQFRRAVPIVDRDKSLTVKEVASGKTWTVKCSEVVVSKSVDR